MSLPEKCVVRNHRFFYSSSAAKHLFTVWNLAASLLANFHLPTLTITSMHCIGMECVLRKEEKYQCFFFVIPFWKPL